MNLFPSWMLAMEDLGSTVEFVLIRNSGWVGTLAGPAVVCGAAFYSWRARSLIAMLFAACAAITVVRSWLQSRETLLRVSPVEVIVGGTVDNRFIAQLTIPVNEITSFGWSAGGEDDNGGLYVATGWQRSYVLPGATEAQGRAIIDVIAERFPELPIADRTTASMLFGDKSGITSLGLVDSEAPSSDSPK